MPHISSITDQLGFVANMPAPTVAATPSISTFLNSLKHTDVENAIETFISLLKRRQIKNSRPCAIATAQLLLRVVAAAKIKDAAPLIERVRKVGQRIIAAQPRELAVGNIVRRVLGLIREVVEEGGDADAMAASDAEHDSSGARHNHDSLQRPMLSSNISSFSPLRHGASVPSEPSLLPPSNSGSRSPFDNDMTEALLHRPQLQSIQSSFAGGPNSLFGLLSTPDENSPAETPPPGTQSPPNKLTPKQIAGLPEQKLDVKAEVIQGIQELLDELDVVDDQIASSALDHIHSNEIILTHTSSQTVQKFLMTAARKRKFTVVHVESYPNDHLDTHSMIMTGHKKGADADEEADERWKPLTAMGITVILIPDSAVFALMSRVNKVILAPHSVLANGGLIAAAGTLAIAQAAKVHQTPVVVVSGVYKLSPVYPFDTEELIEYGDPGKVVGFNEGDMVENVEVVNPIFDYVPPELVDLYITNL